MLRELISQEEYCLMTAYISEYADVDNCDIHYLLREWDNKKSEYLYKLLGEKFIVSKNINFSMDIEEIEQSIENNLLCLRSMHCSFSEDIDKQIEDNKIIKFFDLWEEKTKDLEYFPDYVDADYLFSETDLATNIYHGTDLTIELPNGKTIKVTEGCKCSKIIGKIANYFGIEEYEAFRIRHSQILNQKKLTGNLCLSIHPLDYMTMSHNDCDWNTCMDWTDECGGEYRRGTINMMNSPCVIVAYLTSDTTFQPCYTYDLEWSNKKWRQLFIVTEDVISEVKAYPYKNEYLSTEVLKFIRELAETNLHWLYKDNIFKLPIWSEVESEGLDHRIYIDFSTQSGAMYNDFSSSCDDTYQMYLSSNVDNEVRVDYCGAEMCLRCGELDGEFESEHSLTCQDCDPYRMCARCDERVPMDSLVEIDGFMICKECLEYDCYVCPCCDETHLTEYVLRLYDSLTSKYFKFYNATICEECWEDDLERAPKRWFKDGKPEIRSKNVWFSSRKYVDVHSMTDEGLDELFEGCDREDLEGSPTNDI